jgi:hypothetical protein
VRLLSEAISRFEGVPELEKASLSIVENQKTGVGLETHLLAVSQMVDAMQQFKANQQEFMAPSLQAGTLSEMTHDMLFQTSSPKQELKISSKPGGIVRYTE